MSEPSSLEDFDAQALREAYGDCGLTDRELYAADVVGKHYETKLKGVLRNVIIAVAAVAAIVIFGGTAMVVMVRQEGINRASDIRAEGTSRANAIAAETKARAAEIQRSRLILLIEGCEGTNSRYLDTTRALVALSNRPRPALPVAASPAAREVLQIIAAQQQGSEAAEAARLIVSALVPYTPDCASSARQRLRASTTARPTPVHPNP